MQTVTSFQPKFKLNANHRKEKGFFEAYALFDLERPVLGPETDKHILTEVAEIRFYKKGATVFCVCWICPERNEIATGSGKASGTGYDKKEAAALTALEAAGFQFSEESNINDMLIAIAKHFNLQKYFIFNAHG